MEPLESVGQTVASDLQNEDEVAALAYQFWQEPVVLADLTRKIGFVREAS